MADRRHGDGRLVPPPATNGHQPLNGRQPNGQSSAPSHSAGTPAPRDGEWDTQPINGYGPRPSIRDQREDPPTDIHPRLGPAQDAEPATEAISQVRPAAGPAVPETNAPETNGQKADVAADRPTRASRRHRRTGRTHSGTPVSAYTSRQEEKGGKKPRTGRRRRSTFWKELPLLIVVALLLTFLIQTFLAKVYVIPSGSMETTLHGCTGCNNDRVLVDKITYRFTDPAPGDVVVFRGPDSWNSEFAVEEPPNAFVRGLQQFGSLIGLAPPDEKDFVKRVIAVGGQTVSCCDSRNRVMVDGQPLEEPYVYYLPELRSSRQDTFAPVTVPPGQLWVMGDSRNNSADSRVPGHGPIPVDNVIGKARLIVLPFSRFGWIDAIDPQTSAATVVGAGQDRTGAGTPLALGMVGTLPLAVWRRRRARTGEEEFLLGP